MNADFLVKESRNPRRLNTEPVIIPNLKEDFNEQATSFHRDGQRL
jgi:hypothetical protein